MLVHKNAIKIAEGSKIPYSKTKKTRKPRPEPDKNPKV